MKKEQMTDWEKLALEIEQQDWRELAASIAITVISLLGKNGMTKQELAEKMGVKPQYVSRVVKGKSNLTLDTIVKLERALGESIVYVNDPTPIIESRPSFIPSKTKWDVVLHTPRTVINESSLKKQQKAVYSMNDDFPLAS